MNPYVTGYLIKKIREANNLTQVELAHKLFVSDNTISKWETGKGLPDISLIEPLAKALGISVTELLSGNQIANTNRHANMLNIKFYVCPICHNIITSIGECDVSCHGIALPCLDDEVTEVIDMEMIEDETNVRIDHPMTKKTILYLSLEYLSTKFNLLNYIQKVQRNVVLI